MCYFNGVKVSRAEYLRLKDLEASVLESMQELLNKPYQSGFDYGQALVILPNEDRSGIKANAMQWGFLPSHLKDVEQVGKWRYGYKDEKKGWQTPYLTFNAVGEELLLPNKIYRDAALHRRCLMVSSNFYEWRHVYPIGRKGQTLKTAVKYPYSICLPTKEYFYIAGVWQPWVSKETGETVDTFAIITTKANPLMQVIHNSKKRMPLILTDDLAAEWLLSDLSKNEKRISEIVGFQFPHTQMSAHTIDKDFKNSDDPTKHVYYPEIIPHEELVPNIEGEI